MAFCQKEDAKKAKAQSLSCDTFHDPLCLMPVKKRNRYAKELDFFFEYENPSNGKITEVSSILGYGTSATKVKISAEKDLRFLTNCDVQDVVTAGPLTVILLLIAVKIKSLKCKSSSQIKT